MGKAKPPGSAGAAAHGYRHPVLSVREEREVAQRVDAARQDVIATLAEYPPALRATLQRYEISLSGSAQLRDFLSGLTDDEFGRSPPISHRAPDPGAVPPAWTERFERLRDCVEHGKDCAREVLGSLRLQTDFVNDLVEEFIADVTRRSTWESRLAHHRRSAGQCSAESVDAIRELVKRRDDGWQFARRLLQASIDTGLSTRQLHTVQRRVVLALTHWHKEKSRLITANQRLVMSVARNFVGRGIALQDLTQEGNLGLLRAVDKFDCRRGYKFSTYAVWWIRRAVIHAVATQRGPVQLPFHQAHALYNAQKARTYLTQQLGREPTIPALAYETGMETDALRELLHLAYSTVSLEAPDRSAEPHPAAEVRTSTPADAPDKLHGEFVRKQIERTLHRLPPMQALVVRMRFGIGVYQEYTLAEIGRRFGLSRERIRQIESDALQTLREIIPPVE